MPECCNAVIIPQNSQLLNEIKAMVIKEKLSTDILYK